MTSIIQRVRSAFSVLFGMDDTAVVKANYGYDAAQTTPNNRRRWQYARDVGANTLNSPEVRRILRTRARYEARNNSYCDGMIQTLINYVIGTGASLQFQSDNPELNSTIEKAFVEWTKAVKLWDKIRAGRRTKLEDGEVFILKGRNPKLNNRIKNDVQLIESELCTSFGFDPSDPRQADGIKFDEYGNPVQYEFLNRYPNSSVPAITPFGTKTVPAENIIHWYRMDRPNQKRGVPEITPALELFSMLRSYTLAVIDSAQTAANIAGIAFTTNAPATKKVTPFVEFQPDRNTISFLPANWDFKQLHAEQPTTTYAEFKKEIINEIARCLNMPYNIAAANSSSYNYASGRLDHQGFYKFISVERQSIEQNILNDLFSWFLSAYLIQVGVPRGVDILDVPFRWVWSGFGFIDPLKEAKAITERLNNRTTSLQRECALIGTDWETIQDQQLEAEVRERDRRAELGLPEAEAESESGDVAAMRTYIEDTVEEMIEERV